MWVEVLNCLFDQFHSMSNHFWSSCFLVEKRQESFYAFFSVVQQHLIEQHGMKTTSLECLRIHIYRVSRNVVIHACYCCFSSSNEFVPTDCTSFTGGWVIIVRPRGCRMGPLMPALAFYELIRRHSRSNPGFCDEGNCAATVKMC